MRAKLVPLLVLLPVVAAGCASTAPSRPASTPTAAPAGSSCTGCPAAPTWACCNPQDGCKADDCGYIQPHPAPPSTICEENTGRQCEDGLPPVAGRQCEFGTPPVMGACGCTIPDDPPCGLGPARPGQVQFVVIGDWGDSCCKPSCANLVADMIKRWNDRWPIDFILTTGDNFYPNGDQAAFNCSMPMYDWISPHPVAGQPAHFLPSLGNHDLYDGCCGKPYQDYFQALGGGSSQTPRYYEYSAPGDLIDVYALNADKSEPDGITAGSRQGKWLQDELLSRFGQVPWHIVYFHEPPFSTHDKGFEPEMDWPFQAWGATLVLNGHVHAYERIVRNAFTYVTNGIGGIKSYDHITQPEGCTPTTGSQVRYNGSSGALIGVATANELRFCLMALDRANPGGVCIDNFSFKK